MSEVVPVDGAAVQRVAGCGGRTGDIQRARGHPVIPTHARTPSRSASCIAAKTCRAEHTPPR
jgi:hypothetical protein